MTIPDADQLISVLPDSIIIDGWAGLGRKFFPNQGVGVVDENDGFSGTFLVRSGLKFTIGTTRIITSPNEVEGGLDFPLKQVDLTVRLKNSIPLAGTVKLLMGNDTTMMDTVIQVDVPRGPLANRRAAAAETTYTVGLDAREIEIMKRKPLFTRQILMFQSNQGDTAWIFPEDSLAVQANATIFYTVNPNEEGN